MRLAEKRKMVFNQRGSVTVELIGLLPLVFLILMICWQFLVGVYAVITAQSAANEAAKVYAITRDYVEAMDAAQHIVSAAGGGISYQDGAIHAKGDGYFTAEIDVAVDLVFIPSSIRDNLDPEDRVISFQRELTSRVIR